VGCNGSDVPLHRDTFIYHIIFLPSKFEVYMYSALAHPVPSLQLHGMVVPHRSALHAFLIAIIRFRYRELTAFLVNVIHQALSS